MRVADYVIKRLEEERVKQIFMLSGGGIMYLVDALGRSNIEYICWAFMDDIPYYKKVISYANKDDITETD